MRVVYFVRSLFVRKETAGQRFIQRMQITNKIILEMHNTYAVFVRR
jgi:hypothetical protein